MTKPEQSSSFVWTDQYSVDVPEIDREHRVLFGVVDRLAQAMRSGEGRQKLAALLREMILYTQEHFLHEEQMMAASRFPGFEAHKREHTELTTAVLAFHTRYESGETTITIELMQFLLYWLRNHIDSCDRRLGEYLRDLSN